MQFPLQSFLLVLAVHFCFVHCSLNFNLDDYLDVYPDPTDPGVLQNRTPLYFALIQSLGGPLSQFDGSGSIAGVKVALDRINNDTDLLPGYTLHYTFSDSKCNRTESFKSFFKQILLEPTKIAVIGSGCSPATEPTAEVSSFYNITHISCVSSSTSLRNRVRYPYYFQLLNTEETLAFAFYGVIKEYNWKRVALIVQNENLFTVTVDTLKTLFDRTGVEYSEKLFESKNGISDLDPEPFDKNSRIFLIFSYAVHARPLLCEAYKRNIRLPRHLLLTAGWYEPFWWKAEDDDTNLTCTVEERESVLKSSLALLHFFFLNETADRNRNTTTGITGGEFLDEEMTHLNQPPLYLNKSTYSQYCYDATWTLAYAINLTISDISNSTQNNELATAYNVTSPFVLEDFTYDSNALLQTIFNNVKMTLFDGITGEVRFGEEGIRNLNKLIVYQFRDMIDSSGKKLLDWVEIGNVLPNEQENDSFEFIYRPPENEDTVWNGLRPYDGIPYKKIVSIHPGLTAICSLLATLGIVFAVVCLAFNFIYRNSKLIRLASAKLNILIGVGAIILYVDLYFFVIPVTNKDVVSVFCNLTPWLTAIGYSLCYGTILVKMARVYYIFSNPSAKKKGIRDWMLVLGVASMVAIDLIMLTTYMIVEGVKGNLSATQVTHKEVPTTVEGPLDIITEQCTYICDSKSRNIFLGFLYGYKMLLQVMALFLSFSIRKVKVKGLNDAKSIAASIYVTSMVLAVLIVSSYTLKAYINVFASLFCIGFFAGTTVILILVFVPLMVGLYRDPEGENIFTKSRGSEQYNMNNLTKSINPAMENESLKKRIEELEAELKYEKEKHGNESNHIPISPASITPTPINLVFDVPTTPKATSPTGSVAKVLENSHMLSEEEAKARTFTGTIWDTTEVDSEHQNGDIEKGNEILHRNI